MAAINKPTEFPGRRRYGLSPIEAVIADIQRGKMVIMVDDEGRENEGDLTIAAECITPAAINFMVTHGRGLLCLTLTPERCQALELGLMVDGNDDLKSTRFTVTVDAARGIATGISAKDRATTIRTAVAPTTRPEDLDRPGHVSPLMAQAGGVLVRRGHTEAGCDLARLAGLSPAAVLIEILNADGSAARRSDLERFAEQHELKIGTIDSLVEYRRRGNDGAFDEASKADE